MAKKRLSKGKRTPHVLEGGPWDGQTLHLHSPGTLPFMLKGQKGRYNEKGKWEARV